MGDQTTFTWLEKHIKEPVKKWKIIDTGWDHTVYVLDECWVLRVPKAHKTINLEEEKLLGNLQNETSVMLPAIRIVRKPSGKEAMLYPYIQGNPITGDLAGTILKDAARQLGRFLTNLHSADSSLYRLPKRDRSYYDQMLGKIRSFYPVLPASVTAYTENLFQDLEPIYTSVVHGDLSAAHVLWNKSSAQVGIIDFSDAHIGDPAIDFAGISQVSKGFRDMVLCHYDAADTQLMLKRADQLNKLGLYYELLANGVSRELIMELESRCS